MGRGGRLGGDHVHSRDHVRPVQLLRGLEFVPIGRDRRQEVGRGEMRGERVRQTESRRQLGAEERRSQDVEGDMGTLSGDRFHAGDPALIAEVALQLEHVLGKGVRGAGIAAERAHRDLVRARGPAQAEVDPPRVHRGQGAELFGNGQGRVIGQHDATRPQPDRPRLCSDVGDQHARRRRGDACDVVVLGVPDPLVAEVFRTLGQRHTARKAVAGGLTARDRRQVKDGKSSLRHRVTSDRPAHQHSDERYCSRSVSMSAGDTDGS